MLKVDASFEDRYVCILGLGYVGLTLAATMADAGFKVLGVEIRDSVLRSLKSGNAHFYEPGLNALIGRLVQARQIKFVKHIPSQSRATVYIITVGTPLDSNRNIRLDMIDSVTKEVAGHLKDDDLVVARSTVKIGTTRKIIQPLLQKAGVNFDLAFCPERTLEGNALVELRRLPQIVGGANFHSAVRAAHVFQFLTSTVVRVSDLETAEMIKLIDNSQRDASFAYANEVARLCDRVGISAAEVIRSGKLGYPRTNLPMPGLVGGPCLEKDPYILAASVDNSESVARLTLASRRTNEQQPREVVAEIAALTKRLKGFSARPVISLLGIAFKGRPSTDDLRGTMARPVFDALRDRFPQATFRGYDPVVSSAEIRKFGLKPATDLRSAVRRASLALILNNHPTFSDMPVEKLAQDMAKPALFYDFWNIFTGRTVRFPEGVGYVALGSHGRAVMPKTRR